MKPSKMMKVAAPSCGISGRVGSLLLVLLPGLACTATAAPGATAAEAGPAVEPQQRTDPAPVEPASPAGQEPDTRPGIAVLPFARGLVFGIDPEAIESFGVGVQQILITELAQNTQLRVVDRSVIRDIMAEQDLVVSGRVDPETAARVGHLVGARYVITGGFNQDTEGLFRLDGRIVDVETSEILHADRTQTRGASAYYAAILTLSNELTESVELPPLPVEVRDARESRGASIPRQAVILYSQAQFFQDRGETDRARRLYVRITNEFPQLTEAAEALRQIGT